MPMIWAAVSRSVVRPNARTSLSVQMRRWLRPGCGGLPLFSATMTTAQAPEHQYDALTDCHDRGCSAMVCLALAQIVDDDDVPERRQPGVRRGM